MMDFLAKIALILSPAEYFALNLLFCAIPIAFSRYSMRHSFGAMLLGAALGLVGFDPNSEQLRFTPTFWDYDVGIPFHCVLLGFVLIPWLIRTQTEAWFPFSARLSTATTLYKRAILVAWRMLVTFLVLYLLLNTHNDYGNLGIYLAVLLGILGYFFYRVGIPWLPLYFSFQYALLLEENLRRAFLLSRGSLLEIIASRPIAATLLCLVLALLISSALFRLYRARKKKNAL